MKVRVHSWVFALAVAVVALPAAQAQTSDDDGSVSASAFLDENQRRDIRSQLEAAMVSLDQSEAKAAVAGEPMVATFIDLSRRYLEMVRLATLGEDRYGNPGAIPSRAEMITLMDRTEVHIDAFRERYAQDPEMQALLPRLDAMTRQLGDARRRLAVEMALEGSSAPLNANADAVFERAQTQLDLAARRIEGTSNEAELRARLDELQARLDRARAEAGGIPGGREAVE